MAFNRDCGSSLNEQGDGVVLFGTGGGGAMESAFWLSEQRRNGESGGMRGCWAQMWTNSSKTEVTEAKKALEERMRVVDEIDKETWS